MSATTAVRVSNTFGSASVAVLGVVGPVLLIVGLATWTRSNDPHDLVWAGFVVSGVVEFLGIVMAFVGMIASIEEKKGWMLAGNLLLFSGTIALLVALFVYILEAMPWDSPSDPSKSGALWVMVGFTALLCFTGAAFSARYAYQHRSDLGKLWESFRSTGTATTTRTSAGYTPLKAEPTMLFHVDGFLLGNVGTSV